VNECVQLCHVLEFGVAVEQQRGVVGTRQPRGMQLLQVAREARDALSIKEPIGGGG